MNWHFSFKTAKSSEIEKEINQHVGKLGKRLQAFRPDLVHLHGTLDSGPPDGFNVSLNLRLPSGQLSSHDSGASAVSAVKTAFSDLLAQVQRHKEVLRSEHKWRRQNPAKQAFAESATEVTSAPAPKYRNGRAHARSNAAKQPSVRAAESTNGESTAEEIGEATFQNPQTVQTDVRSYINANLPRLERFVQRELRYRESSGQLQANLVTPDEVIDEAVVTALSSEEKLSNLSIERWLYRLAIQAINRVAKGNRGQDQAIPLEQSVGTQNVTGSDEAFLQFHQPGESLHREDVTADTRAGNPEELAASDEVIDQLEQALHGARPQEREAFVLFAIEGFTVDEISQVTDRDAQLVRNDISAARNQLIKKLPANNRLKQRLMQISEVA